MRWLKTWWPALVWAVVISGFSTGAFTAEHTSRIIIPILHWLFPHAAGRTLYAIHHIIRKCAHFTEYFILSLLILRGIRGGTARHALRVGARRHRASSPATRRSMNCTSLSCPGARRRVGDVLIDTSGGIAAQASCGAGDAVGPRAADRQKRRMQALKADA